MEVAIDVDVKQSLELPMEADVRLALCAAGTGILPMLHILDSVLLMPAATCTVLYCDSNVPKEILERVIEAAVSTVHWLE